MECAQRCQGFKKTLFTILKVILGLGFLLLGGLAIINWWEIIILLIKGCLGLFLILAGVITLALAKE
ncbi:MAG: hypothetical protein M0Q96_03515 [Candidatus Omnitrophica bacterium]|jgi:hypothetical protein|nr:hypothetical protein [Candidatus Omnitrophota bacterium]